MNKTKTLHRVVITGMAGISPLGNDWAAVRGALERNESGIVRMHAWENVEDLNTRVAAPAKPFELDPVRFSRKRTRSMGRVAVMAVKTALDALEDAGLADSPVIASPETGIVTAIVAGFLVSAFGGSSVQIGGPTGAFIIIVYGIVQQYGMSGLTVATLMAGAFLVLLGVFRLGTIIKYIPYPIVVGFTSGIAVTIFTTQVKDLLGLTTGPVPADFVAKWATYAAAITTIDPWSTAVGVLSVAVIALTPLLSRKVPGSLVAIVLMTLGAYLLRTYAGVGSIETIGDRFSINAELPEATMPALTWEGVKQLVQPAITIAVLGAIESLLSATVADGVTGRHHDSNQELIGQGIANLCSPIFGGNCRQSTQS